MDKKTPMGSKTSPPFAFRTPEPQRRAILRAAKAAKVRVSDWLRDVTARAVGL